MKFLFIWQTSLLGKKHRYYLHFLADVIILISWQMLLFSFPVSKTHFHRIQNSVSSDLPSSGWRTGVCGLAYDSPLMSSLTLAPHTPDSRLLHIPPQNRSKSTMQEYFTDYLMESLVKRYITPAPYSRNLIKFSFRYFCPFPQDSSPEPSTHLPSLSFLSQLHNTFPLKQTTSNNTLYFFKPPIFQYVYSFLQNKSHVIFFVLFCFLNFLRHTCWCSLRIFFWGGHTTQRVGS